jgi:2-dehydropantoate 2-reductase
VIERVCVIGGGTVGSLLAAHLAAVCEVSVLTRREGHAAALCEQGLRVSGKRDLKVPLFATSHSDELPEFDLGILACKAGDLEVCAKRIAGLCPSAALMTVQNGLGAESLVASCGPWPVISAVTFISGIRLSDVHVEYELDAPTWLGPCRQTGTPYRLVEEAEALLRASGLKTESMPEVTGAQWSKLIFNSAINTVAALTGLSHVASFAAEDDLGDLGRLVRALMEEGVAVAAAAGVSLHDDPWQMNLDALARGNTRGSDYAHTPSMLEDVLAHTPTELEFITGALLREADRCGVAAPLSEAMYSLVRARETSWTDARPRPSVATRA